MPYKTWATNDVVNAADLNALTADANMGFVTTAESTTTTTFGDNLTTVGPSASLSVVSGQQCLVLASARCENDANTGTTGAAFSFVASGAATLASGDDTSGEFTGNGTGQITIFYWIVATSTATLTVKQQYKRTGASGNAFFRRRRISLKKF